MNPASYCKVTSDGSVKEVQVPLDYDQADARSSNIPVFNYRYRFFPALHHTQDTATVIVIPGGPGGAGGTLMDLSPGQDFPIGAIKNTDFNVIYVDPRGAVTLNSDAISRGEPDEVRVGCNIPKVAGDFPESAYRSDYNARDILEIVKKEKLSNYVIYGGSYGTVVATMAASSKLLDLAKAPSPKKVVLEGVEGHAWSSYAGYFAGFKSEWARVKAELPSDVAAQFATSRPFGYSSTAWANFIFRNSILGLLEGDLASFLGYLPDSPQVEATRAEMIRELSPETGGTVPDLSQPVLEAINEAQAVAQAMNNNVECRELMKGSAYPIDLDQNGDLTYGSGDACEGIDLDPARAYDPKSWQIAAPVYYFEGSLDPATPIQEAREHFAGQRNAPKTFVTVNHGHHGPLMVEMTEAGCSQAIWTAIDNNPSALRAALATCAGLDTRVDSALAQHE
jgi:pimeloyl-ACP methyl ester carboxylesterase